LKSSTTKSHPRRKIQREKRPACSADGKEGGESKTTNEKGERGSGVVDQTTAAGKKSRSASSEREQGPPNALCAKEEAKQEAEAVRLWTKSITIRDPRNSKKSPQEIKTGGREGSEFSTQTGA